MTLNDATKKAILTDNPKLLGQVVDTLRFKFGYTYERCYQWVNSRYPIEPDVYDAMLYAADEMESHGNV